MMTALATGLAVTLGDAGVSPVTVEHPMAVVIVGGLITSTFRNLFIVPALYLRWGRGGGLPVPVPVPVRPNGVA
jgi:multidrug efflux pump subunit AcrB